MPDPKTCGKRFKIGSQAYKNCIAYKGKSAKKSKVKGKPVDEMSRVRTKGGY